MHIQALNNLDLLQSYDFDNLDLMQGGLLFKSIYDTVKHFEKINRRRSSPRRFALLIIIILFREDIPESICGDLVNGLQAMSVNIACCSGLHMP